jgi:hypothetical protein
LLDGGGGTPVELNGSAPMPTDEELPPRGLTVHVPPTPVTDCSHIDKLKNCSRASHRRRIVRNTHKSARAAMKPSAKKRGELRSGGSSVIAEFCSFHAKFKHNCPQSAVDFRASQSCNGHFHF